MPRTAELRRRLSSYGVEAGALILFAGWDSLQPEVGDHGRALGEEYLPLHWPIEKEAVSLRDVAAERARMPKAAAKPGRG